MNRKHLLLFEQESTEYQDLRTIISASQQVVEERALEWLHYLLVQVGIGAHITSASEHEMWDYEPTDFIHLRIRISVDAALQAYLRAHSQKTGCEDLMSCLQLLSGYETERHVMQCALTHFRWVVTEASQHHRIIIVSGDYETSHAVTDPKLPFPTMRPTIFADN